MSKEIGCKNCPNAPKTYEEYCLSRHSFNGTICPDVFEEHAKNCNLYDKSLEGDKEEGVELD